MFLISRSRFVPRHASRLSPLYAVLHAALQTVAGIVLQPVIILAAVAFLLGGSNYQIAAFAVIALATWALAPLAMVILSSATGQSYPVVLGAGAIRFAAAMIIGIVGWRIDSLSPERIVSSLILAFLIYQAASAIAGQSTSNVILTGVPRNQQLAIFRRRGNVAAIVAVLGAIACWSVFRSDEAFQRSVGLLLMLAAFSLASATWFLLSIRSGDSRSLTPQSRQMLASVRDAFRRSPFRRYAAFKILLALTASFDPFVIVFGFQELGLGTEYIGWAILAYAGGQLAGHLGWSRWIAGHGPRVPFQVATFLRLLFLTWIVSLPTLASSNLYTDRFDDLGQAMGGFAAAFALLGLAMSVGQPANQRYLMDIAPRAVVQGPILATNLIAGVFAFGPFGVAWLMGRYDLERLLWGGIGIAIIALLASGLLLESRVRIRTSPGSWRSRQRTARTI